MRNGIRSKNHEPENGPLEIVCARPQENRSVTDGVPTLCLAEAQDERVSPRLWLSILFSNFSKNSFRRKLTRRDRIPFRDRGQRSRWITRPACPGSGWCRRGLSASIRYS